MNYLLTSYHQWFLQSLLYLLLSLCFSSSGSLGSVFTDKFQWLCKNAEHLSYLICAAYSVINGFPAPWLCLDHSSQLSKKSVQTRNTLAWVVGRQYSHLALDANTPDYVCISPMQHNLPCGNSSSRGCFFQSVTCLICSKNIKKIPQNQGFQAFPFAYGLSVDINLCSGQSRVLINF